jgi:hypothetical protein
LAADVAPRCRRASDADRDVAADILCAAVLCAAVADGRLTLAGLEERLEDRWSLLQSLLATPGDPQPPARLTT